ncbi:MurR/RpiR family transcriptional regulator [Calidithermus roseus]|uniref:Putative HTH-type transcriptional regulator YbbH n=1 Tax=Calidithermus roseus TaxID=1644118 RepID=A0A399ERJ3_9DEIN|nr:MurR/RpiR family transcriptional regulator [Calidithermus roseus]RIH85182.1 putative HTH-type transcriptional regulator YbbH [Calidithermus roseus]
MPNGALASLRSLGKGLTPALRKIAEYVRENPEQLLYQTVVEVAEASGSSEASVIRFCRDLGFSGFQEFKLALASDLAANPVGLTPQENPRTAPEVLEYVTHHARQALEDTVRMLDLAVVEAVVERILGAKRLEFYGVGASGVTAMDFAYKFLRLGYMAQAYPDPHLAAMSASTLDAQAVAVGISRSGTTIDTVKALELAQQAGATTVAITHRAKSPLARAATFTLTTPVAESPLTGGSVSAKMGQLLLLDLLYTLVGLRHPRSSEHIAKTAAAVADRNY